MSRKHYILSSFLVASLLFLVSCSPKSPTEGLRDFTAEEHFAEARRCHEAPEDLPLAIWHYQQFLLDAESTSELVPIAKIEYEQCLKEFLVSADFSRSQNAAIQDKEEQLRLLKLRNAELESWISRLNTENLSLRQALLKAQEGNK